MRRARHAARRLARPRGLLTATLLALVAGGTAVALAGGGAESGDGSGADATATGATARVERRTLAEQLSVGGTIGYAGESAVLARLSGTVTAVPALGDQIERGEQLYALGGKPVLLMYGAVPAYRDLADGIEDGVDVKQLEENLAALGYEPGTVDEEFTAATASAVGSWQEELGLKANETVELGRVAFLPGPRRVTAIEVTLGEAIGSGGGGGAETPGDKAAATEAEASDPASVPVLKTSSTKRVVSVELDPDQQSLARRGQRVRVLLPGGEEARGEVRRIAVSEGSGSAAPEEDVEPGIDVTVSLLGKTKVPALDGAAVSVLFTQNVRKDVLSVPLTALLATGEDRFAVVVLEGTARRRIAVQPGLAADGYVAVKGKGLHAGMLVESGE